MAGAKPIQRVAIVAVLDHTRTALKLESTIKNHAKIRSMHYLTEEDRNGWPQIRVAIYMAEATDLRLLKSSLANIANSRDCEILIR